MFLAAMVETRPIQAFFLEQTLHRIFHSVSRVLNENGEECQRFTYASFSQGSLYPSYMADYSFEEDMFITIG